MNKKKEARQGKEREGEEGGRSGSRARATVGSHGYTRPLDPEGDEGGVNE